MKLISLLFCSIFLITNICYGQILHGSFTDERDGNVYKTICLDNFYEWIAENMAFLPEVSDPSEQLFKSTDSIFISQPHYYVYNYHGNSVYDAKVSLNYSIYGVLYNWEASKTACPNGFSLPKPYDVQRLMAQIKKWNPNSIDLGGHMKDVRYWNDPNAGATNNSEFGALPGGCVKKHRIFKFIGEVAYFWGISTDSPYWVYYLTNDYQSVFHANFYPDDAYSVRCLRIRK